MRFGFLAVQDARSRMYRHVATVGLVALLLFLWMTLSPGKGATIVVSAAYSKPGVAQWYYDTGRGFSEEQSVTRPARAGINQLRFELPPGEYQALRFDPINRKDADIVIYAIQVEPESQARGGPLELGSLRAGANIETFEPAPKGMHVATGESSVDPQLSVVLAKPLHVTLEHKRAGHALVASFLLAMLLVWLLQTLIERLGTVALVGAGFTAALVLILAMDWMSISVWNQHPDEPLHLSCFYFYLVHFWPAPVGAPSTVASLTSSPFGTSYLNQYDIVYFIAGHLMAAFSFLFDSTLAMARAFQHVLWVVLLLMAVRSRAWALALAAALVSPQIWYLFSYFNGDAFPLFLCLVAAALMGDPDGGVQRYMRGERMRPTGAILVLALCLGLVVVSKSNFMPVVVGMFAWLAVQHARLRWRELLSMFLGIGLLGTWVLARRLGADHLGFRPGILAVSGGLLGLLATASLGWRYWRDRSVRPQAHKLALLAGLVVLVALPRIADDLYLNGSPSAKVAAIEAAKETYAMPAFKPSTLATGGGFKDLQIARKGVSLDQMLFEPLHWFQISARSAFGTYGYMNIWASPDFYAFAWWMLGALVVYLVAGLWVDHRSVGARLAVVALLTAALVVLSSILFSWVVGFQPQGRYLLPMAAMLCLMMGTAGRWLEKLPGKLLLLTCIGLSMASFAGVAIPGIALHL